MKIQRIKKTGSLFKTAFIKWFQREPFREGAIIAYYAIFAIPGLLVVVISITGYFFGGDVVSGHLHKQIAGVMGLSTADQVQEMLLMTLKSKDTLWATIIGLAVIIIGATALFAQLQKSLNNIWQVEAKASKSGIWPFIRTRLFSFGLIVTIAFLLLVSLVLSSLLSALSSWIMKYWTESLLVVFQILNTVFSLAIIAVLFSLMFKILPDAKVKWRSVWLGACVTSVLFEIGKTGLGFYFGKANPGSGYGVAGSIILILLWASYSSMIVFLGAEFTKVYSDYYYGEIPPDENAVKQKVGIISAK